MDLFTALIVGGLGVFFVAVILLGIFHPRSGADVLQWRPTRSPEVEAQNELDDISQMISAQNRIRARGGKAPRTIEEIEAQVREQEQRMRDYADEYWRGQREERVGAVNAEGGFTAYVVSTCSKCKRLDRILAERDIAYETVDLIQTPLDAAALRDLFATAELEPREAVRITADGARALMASDPSDDELLAAMAADPTLIARPIVVRGDRGVLARPTERALELL